MMTKYVVSPITTSYLTKGKKYEVTEEAVLYNGENTFAKIIDDDGDPISILYKRCCHLNGLDWIVVEEQEEDEVETVYVKAPKNTLNLTKGKIYKATKNYDYRNIYNIINDNDYETNILINCCAHLNGLDWIVVDPENIRVIEYGIPSEDAIGGEFNKGYKYKLSKYGSNTNLRYAHRNDGDMRGLVIRIPNCAFLQGGHWDIVEEYEEIKREENQMKNLSVAKVGDKYRCLNGDYWVSFIEGNVYNVTGIGKGCVFLDHRTVTACFYNEFEKVEQTATQKVDFNTTITGTIDGVDFELVNPTWQGLLEGFMNTLEQNGFEIDPKRRKAILSVAKHAKIEL